MAALKDYPRYEPWVESDTDENRWLRAENERLERLVSAYRKLLLEEITDGQA